MKAGTTAGGGTIVGSKALNLLSKANKGFDTLEEMRNTLPEGTIIRLQVPGAPEMVRIIGRGYYMNAGNKFSPPIITRAGIGGSDRIGEMLTEYAYAKSQYGLKPKFVIEKTTK